MFLNKIAQARMGEWFASWDGEKFVRNSFKGRIAIFDRFLSIYNRPTRKRQLYVKPGTRIPESLAIQHQASGEIYIVGQGRADARDDVDGGKAYVDMYMLHNCTPNPDGSSGLALHTRKEAQGPDHDPGWLVNTDLGSVFMDMEFRTSSAEEGMYDSKTENFYAWAPLPVKVNQHDFFELNGISYRVVDTFVDAGMRGLRLDREPDNRVDFVIRVVGNPVFNPVTYEEETNIEDFNVTGTVTSLTDLARWRVETRTNSTITVVVDEKHIGFTPTPNMVIMYQGLERRIRDVSTQAGERQFTLTCE